MSLALGLRHLFNFSKKSTKLFLEIVGNWRRNFPTLCILVKLVIILSCQNCVFKFAKCDICLRKLYQSVAFERYFKYQKYFDIIRTYKLYITLIRFQTIKNLEIKSSKLLYACFWISKSIQCPALYLDTDAFKTLSR